MAEAYMPERPDEKVLFEQRRHWITLGPALVSMGGLILVIIVGEYLLGRYADQIAKYVPLSILHSVALLLGVLTILIALVGWWVYTQNRLILTNFHIVQITQAGLLNRTMSQLSLTRVQDVETKQKGLLAHAFGFGDVVVETAGEEENFVFRQVPRPYDLCGHIMRAHDAVGQGSTPSPDGLA